MFYSRSIFEKRKLAFNFSKMRRRQIGICPAAYCGANTDLFFAHFYFSAF